MSQLQQNLPPNSTDASMDASLNLVSTQRKEIKRLTNLMVPNRAQEFVQTHNTHVDKKTKQRVPNKIPRYDMLPVKDYDGDNLNDTIVTKDGKVYSFNGFIAKDTDYPLRQAYLNQGFKHENKKGKSVYSGYSMKKMREHHYNPMEPRQGYYVLNADFGGQIKDVAQHYPTVRKYQQSSNYHERTAVQTIVDEIITPVWRAAKVFAKNNPNVRDITQGVSFVEFKSDLIKTLLTDSINGYDNMKPSEKKKAANSYFDSHLRGSLGNFIVIAIQTLIGDKVSEEQAQAYQYFVLNQYGRPDEKAEDEYLSSLTDQNYME